MTMRKWETDRVAFPDPAKKVLVKRLALLSALVLVIAACGDDDAITTTFGTTAATGSTMAATTSAAPATTGAPATTAATATATFDGPTDCLEIWPETSVQAIAGPEFTFFDANPDRSACTYTSLPNGIALAWRTSDAEGFEQSKVATGAVSGVEDVSICDGGFVTELQGTVIIMEGYSAAQGRAYTATLTGMDLGAARARGQALIQGACG